MPSVRSENNARVQTEQRPPWPGVPGREFTVLLLRVIAGFPVMMLKTQSFEDHVGVDSQSLPLVAEVQAVGENSTGLFRYEDW